MDNGYVKLYRQLLNSDIFASPIGLKIWIWCLLRAGHAERTISMATKSGESIIYLQRGQFVYGRIKAAEDLSMTESNVYKWMKKFENENMIIQNSNNRYTTVTICNYDNYQGFSDEKTDESNNWQTANKQLANSYQTANKQLSNTNKKGKKDKNDKNDKNNRAEPEKFNFLKSLIELGVSEQIANDWITVRKTKKASNTETAFKSIKREIEQSGMTADECIRIAVERSWQGFKAAWVNNNANDKQNNETKEKENEYTDEQKYADWAAGF